MSLISYISRRFLAMIPILSGVLLLTFALTLQLPGSPFNQEGSKINYETAGVAEAALGLDKTIYIQLGMYILNILKGNWGN